MMTAEHRRPLAAFLLVFAASCLVMGNGLRGQMVDVFVSAGAPRELVAAIAPDMVLGHSLSPTQAQARPSAPSEVPAAHPDEAPAQDRVVTVVEPAVEVAPIERVATKAPRHQASRHQAKNHQARGQRSGHPRSPSAAHTPSYVAPPPAPRPAPKPGSNTFAKPTPAPKPAPVPVPKPDKHQGGPWHPGNPGHGGGHTQGPAQHTSLFARSEGARAVGHGSGHPDRGGSHGWGHAPAQHGSRGHAGHGNPGHGNSGPGNSGHGNPGHGNPGHGNSGPGNPGHGNSGHGH